MKKTGIIFPHQLFEENILTSTCDTIYLVEEWLFFRQYNFHKRKTMENLYQNNKQPYYLRNKLPPLKTTLLPDLA